ncbi:MAG TPA: 4Fe-4S dicluster domain-containing protein [Candidatus Limnocylindrales bacterium]|nr:4Fe-4S dicluster domain-containing protein [Candidatus Limnocylindrales bacterium]
MTVATRRISTDTADRRLATPHRRFTPLDIASDRCKGCELCVHICPKHVLALDERVVNRLGYHPVYLTDAEACTSCALCARICPDVAFAVYARPKGA